MEPGNLIAYIVLAVIVACALWGTIHRIRHGSSCCGGHDPAPKKIKASDTNRNHYSFTYSLSVDGMHCSNCARRIENAFNRKDGLWAKADIGQKKVDLLTKQEISESECREIVSGAGYTLLSIKRT